MRDLRSIWLAVPTLLAGCGGVEAAGPDAVVVDATPLPPDAIQAGDITLTTYDPPADAVAIFLDAAGVTVDVVPLSPSGVATRSMLPGGSVSMVSLTDNYAYHYTQVQPGDDLRIFSASTVTSMLSVQVTVPTTPGTTQYTVRTPCGWDSAAASPVPVTLYNCEDTTDVFVIADGATDKTIYKPGVTVAASMTVAAAYQALSPLTVNVTNVPAGTTYLDAYGAVYAPGGRFYLGFSYGDSFNAPAAAVAVEADVPTIDGLWTGGAIYTNTDLGQQSLTYREPTATQLVVDLEELPSPFMRNVTYDLDGSAVVWTSAGAGDAPQLAMAEFVVDGAYISTFGPVTGTGRLDVPVLPAPYDVVNVAPTHVVTYSYAFTVLTDDATADAMRQRYYATFDPTPPEGRARLAYGVPL